LNEYGIMHGSILTVHVVEARELKPMDMDGTSDPYVILHIEDQRIETNYKKSTL
jgi:Ca2+-dependent lipid-binding protein